MELRKLIEQSNLLSDMPKSGSNSMYRVKETDAMIKVGGKEADKNIFRRILKMLQISLKENARLEKALQDERDRARDSYDYQIKIRKDMKRKNKALKAEIQRKQDEIEKLKDATLYVTEATKDPKNVVFETVAGGRQVKFCHGVYRDGTPVVSVFKFSELDFENKIKKYDIKKSE